MFIRPFAAAAQKHQHGSQISYFAFSFSSFLFFISRKRHVASEIMFLYIWYRLAHGASRSGSHGTAYRRGQISNLALVVLFDDGECHLIYFDAP